MRTVTGTHGVLRVALVGFAPGWRAAWMLCSTLILAVVSSAVVAHGAGTGIVPASGGGFRMPHGSSLVVTGRVFGYRMTNDALELSLRSAPADRTWTLRVSERRARDFTNLASLVGKAVTARGTVIDENGGVVIGLASPSQIESREPVVLSEEVEIRRVALESAMDGNSAYRRSNSIYYVSCDSCPEAVQEQVLRLLSRHAPIARKPASLNERGDTGWIDEKSGQLVSCWSVAMGYRSETEVRAQVDCHEGPLRGFGLLVVLTKEDGVWKCVYCTGRWLA